ncbi:hypothetical protein ACJX0J_030362, partial [Zea mays]
MFSFHFPIEDEPQPKRGAVMFLIWISNFLECSKFHLSTIQKFVVESKEKYPHQYNNVLSYRPNKKIFFNNTVHNATSTGIIKKYYVKKRGYEISIVDASDG